MATKKFEYKDFEYDDFTHNAYQESDTVKKAQAALNAQLAQKPGAYQSQWQTQLNDTMNKIMNREKFSYDFNGDALYQQYKDKFIQQGKMASADVMGQAAAMTGGYGNSYAATVGNQAYQASLQNLNDIIPELYQMALDRYNQEGQDLLNQYGILGDRENTDYGRYRDTVSDYNSERDYLTGRYDSERNYDYGKYTDDRNFNYGKYSDNKNFAYGKYSDDKSYAYNEHRNAIADEQWQKEFDEAMRQYNENMAFQKQQYNDSKNSASSGSGSSSSAGGSPSGGEISGGSKITSDMLEKAQSFKNNKDLEAYAENLEASGAISHEEALSLVARFMDTNEKYVTSDDGTEKISYKDMVKSTNGWSVESSGGWYIGSINDDMKVRSPNNEVMRLDQLISTLEGEGLTHAEAKKLVKDLQNKLK